MRNNQIIPPSKRPHVNNICLVETSKSNVLCFSQDGQFIAASTWGGGISIISLINGKVIKVKESAHEEGIVHLAFSLDKTKLYSASFDEVKIWDLKTFDCLKQITIKNAHVHFIGFVKNKMCAAYTGDSYCNKNVIFEIVDLNTGDIEEFCDIDDRHVDSLVLSKDSSHIVAVREFKDNHEYLNNFVFWSVDNNKVINRLDVVVGPKVTATHPCLNQGFLFGALAEKVWCAPYNSDLFVFDIKNEKYIKLGVKWDDVLSIDVSFDNQLLLLSSKYDVGGAIHLIDIKKYEILESFAKELPIANNLTIANFLPNSYNFVISNRHSIQLVQFKNIKSRNIGFESLFKDWDKIFYSNNGYSISKIRDEDCLFNITSNCSAITCAAISHDQNRIAACSDNKIRIYDANNGVLLKTLIVDPASNRESVCIQAINFTLDDKYIAFLVKRYDSYKEDFYETLGCKLKNYKIRKSEVNILDSDKKTKKIEKFVAALGKIDLTKKNHTSNNISISIEGSTLVVSKKSGEIFTIYHFNDDEFVSLNKNGCFIASDEAIRKYLLLNTSGFIPEQLSFDDISRFRKTDSF